MGAKIGPHTPSGKSKEKQTASTIERRGLHEERSRPAEAEVDLGVERQRGTNEAETVPPPCGENSTEEEW
jgi:hypothetical protein